jgi:hypothetical protein
MTAMRKSSVGSVGFLVLPVPPHRTHLSSTVTSRSDLGCPEPWQRGHVPSVIASRREVDRDAGRVFDSDPLTDPCQPHPTPLSQRISRSGPAGTLTPSRLDAQIVRSHSNRTCLSDAKILDDAGNRDNHVQTSVLCPARRPLNRLAPSPQRAGGSGAGTYARADAASCLQLVLSVP